ncbi:neprilysin-21-like [Dermacentor andersoni]|uniref:neprilysin-21-like n=1 Tax=Dermacentor andersoni TaxID=34620 RepID=UPI00215509DB|nr:neprilysin-2-like [Dermacentor andersoni]
MAKNMSFRCRPHVEAAAVPPNARTTRMARRSSSVTTEINGLSASATGSIADINLRVIDGEGESRFKEYLVALILLACFAALLLVVLYVLAPTHGNIKADAQGSLACVSDNCLKDAEYLDQLLSWKDAPPCDNFYMFVCHGWKSQYPDAPLSPFVSLDDDHAASLEENVYAMLENKSENSKSLAWLRDLMDKCMDERQIEGDGWDSLLELMSDASVGPFPITPPVRSSLSIWKSAGRLLRATGTSALLGMGVAVAPSGTPKSILAIYPPEASRYRILGTDIVVKLYTSAIFSAVKALKKRFVPVENLLDIARFVADFEKEIGHRAVGAGFRISTANSSSPIAQFLSGVFYDHWPEYFDKRTSDVLISSPNLVRRIIQLVESAERHTVINFISLQMMIQVSPFIPHTELAQFGTFITGRSMMPSPRWRICLRAVEKALAPLMYASYFTYRNLHASASKFAHFVGEAAQEFLRGVENSSYFTMFSKAAFRDVLTNTQFRVLGPPWISDGTVMEAYVQTLPTIRPAHTALQSYTGVHEATFLYSLSRGYSQQWTRSMFTADCWHGLNPRTLYVPLLTFNVTLWSHPSTQFLQVSRAGFRVQKCILEMLLGDAAFTNDQQFWWLDEATRHKLESVESCLQRSVRRSNVQNLLAILKRSLSVLLAYEHFHKSVKGSGKTLKLYLPNGEVLTETQLFFIVLVMQSCGKRPPADGPSSLELEWNAALANYPGMSAAFRCARGSPMNPMRQCGT